MSRADRLFRIVQLLRRDRLSTADRLAVELGVSVRTLYRDMRELMASGVAIESEAGAGYRLPKHAELPPLAFTVDELEALVAGARIIQSFGDEALKAAAKSALQKAEAVAPPEVRRHTRHSEIHAPDFFIQPQAARFMGELREALRSRHKVCLDYRKADGTASRRTLHPLGLFFWGHTWSLAAWCELRGAFRTFRLDRISNLEALPDPFEVVEGRSLADYLKVAENS